MQTLKQLLRGELIGTKKLTLACGLTSFPEAIYTLANTLEILDLSNNQLSVLPSNFARLHKLRILFLSNNLFTVFPDVLAQCQSLAMIGFKNNQINHIAEDAIPVQTRWLILTDNNLTQLPKSIGKCTQLEKFPLAGNQLTSLPDEMANCKNLALLRISANQLTTLPEWLLTLPKLSWLAFSGNPFCKKIDDTVLLDGIKWQQLTVTHQLGEGASGIISKAVWQANNNEAKEVAVKIFKGAVTSDGYPEDEMHACIIAGNHPNLVTVLGRINNHPKQKQGLVFGLIPTAFYNLGLPPSFDTCSRDVFMPDTQFTVAQILAIAKAIASVAAHLHSKGIMHGDLYAHNTLVTSQHHTIFGDFGAASLYDITTPQAAYLQRLEVQAYGYLLDDLLQHCTKQHHLCDAAIVLKALVPLCMQSVVLHRPSFADIICVLNEVDSASSFF
ncbi:MAG: leucine-rich repeat-containing protein kinase family protein [Flavobacterium sp.]|nr:leucine-rich repeat-containing protein kinase family protein [Flavobacterium sp.]